MKKIIGILLILIGLAFLVWKFTFTNMSGFPSLGLNILGFMVMALGSGLMKWKTAEKKPVKKTPKKVEEKPSETVKEPEAYKTTDYSKYMPK